MGVVEAGEVEAFDEVFEGAEAFEFGGVDGFGFALGFGFVVAFADYFAAGVEDGFFGVDGGGGADSEGDGVGGAGVDFDFGFGIAVADGEDDAGVVGIAGEVVEEDVSDGGAEFIDDVGEGVVCLGAGRGDVVEAEGDGFRFVGAYPDSEVPVGVFFAEDGDALVAVEGEADAFDGHLAHEVSLPLSFRAVRARPCGFAVGRSA